MNIPKVCGVCDKNKMVEPTWNGRTLPDFDEICSILGRVINPNERPDDCPLKRRINNMSIPSIPRTTTLISSMPKGLDDDIQMFFSLRNSENMKHPHESGSYYKHDWSTVDIQPFTARDRNGDPIFCAMLSWYGR